MSHLSCHPLAPPSCTVVWGCSVGRRSLWQGRAVVSPSPPRSISRPGDRSSAPAGSACLAAGTPGQTIGETCATYKYKHVKKHWLYFYFSFLILESKNNFFIGSFFLFHQIFRFFFITKSYDNYVKILLSLNIVMYCTNPSIQSNITHTGLLLALAGSMPFIFIRRSLMSCSLAWPAASGKHKIIKTSIVVTCAV